MTLKTIEATGKSVDAAVFNGLKQLEISIDEVTIEVLQHEIGRASCRERV